MRNLAPGHRLLLFYPTSAVHVRDWQQVFRALAGWKILALVYEPQEYFAPGILAALREQGVPTQVVERGYDFDALLPQDASVVVLGAVFEAFGLDLIRWSKMNGKPVAAIEEVAQLGLNQDEINNYDAPFDRLFVASPDEYQRFIKLGYPPAVLKTSGLLAYDRIRPAGDRNSPDLRRILGISDRPKPIVYTTSPLCSRISIHTRDNTRFRDSILRQIAIAGQRTGRPIVIKLHPSEDPGKVLERIRATIPDAIVIGREYPMDELFSATGVLVNRGNSQTCLEAILRGVPTVVAACGIRSLFHEGGGTYVVDTFDAIPDAVFRALDEAPPGVDDLKAKYFFSPEEGVATLVARELDLLALSPPVAGDSAWDWLIRSMLFAGEFGLVLSLSGRLGKGSQWRESVVAALDAHLSGRRDEAIARWRECTELDGTWYWPHFELAHAYAAAGLHQLAIEHAHQSIGLLPPHYRAWHELPMRRVIMAAHRATGNHSAAAAEMSALEERSLVEVLPELLLEKAEQQLVPGRDFATAIACLDQALQVIEQVPVALRLDSELRTAAQSRLFGLGKRCEDERRYQDAEACYASIVRRFPDNLESRFACARVGLARGRLLGAGSHLYAISGIPDAARKVTAWALPSHQVEALAPFWPTSRGDIFKALRLIGYSYAWLADALRRDRQEWPNLAAVSLLLSLFFLKHVARRLIGD